MYEFFASRPATNNKHVCIGSITNSEADAVRESGLGDGFGYYLYVADSDSPHNPIEVLAHLASEEAAQAISSIMGMCAYADA